MSQKYISVFRQAHLFEARVGEASQECLITHLSQRRRMKMKIVGEDEQQTGRYEGSKGE